MTALGPKLKLLYIHVLMYAYWSDTHVVCIDISSRPLENQVCTQKISAANANAEMYSKLKIIVTYLLYFVIL